MEAVHLKLYDKIMSWGHCLNIIHNFDNARGSQMFATYKRVQFHNFNK